MRKKWTLRELAAETGVPERTIRYYISRELLPPPLKGGRGAAYGEVHKIRIEKIKELQAQGMMLAEIRNVFGAGERRLDRSSLIIDDLESSASKRMKDLSVARLEKKESQGEFELEDELARGGQPERKLLTLPEPETWRAYPVGGDAVVMLRAGTSPWRTKRLLNALGRFAVEIGDDDNENVGIDDGNKKENEDD